MSNTDVVDAVDHIGDAWGLTAEESVGYLDVLKKSSEEYGTDVSSVTSALSEMAPAAKALGLSLDETNGIMNLFASSGLDSSQAITGLTYAAKQVKSPEEFKTMLADIQAIADPTERAQKAVELFGARAGVALSNAFDGNKSLKDFILTTKECTGTVSDASAAFDSNFNVQLELAKKQFSRLAMEIGEKVMPW
jgi:phage-related minor tail protein